MTKLSHKGSSRITQESGTIKIVLPAVYWEPLPIILDRRTQSTVEIITKSKTETKIRILHDSNGAIEEV